MKYIKIFIKAVFLSLLLAGGPFDTTINAQGTSAGVQSAGKAGQTPVNINNGTANFGIPIHAINELDLNLPISLNYQTGGVRVSDIASNIGLGWNLNAGGSIVRIVKDIPDEIYDEELKIFGYLNSDHTAATNCSDCYIDKEPDIFILNYNGNTVRFFLDKDGTIKTVTKTDLKIEAPVVISGPNTGIKQWEVLLPDGTKLFFGKTNQKQAIDRTSFKFGEYNVYFFTNWHVLKTVSPKLNEIDFNYRAESYISYNFEPKEKIIKSLCSLEGNDLVNTFSYNEIEGYDILSIESPYTKVEFQRTSTQREDLLLFGSTDDPRAINSIKISKKNGGGFNCFKEINLTQSYFTSNNDGLNEIEVPTNSYVTEAHLNSIHATDKLRLKLDQIVEVACDGPGSYTTEIDYYEDFPLPRRLSNSQDYWGYHNGAYTNKSLVPSPFVRTDCTPDLDCSLRSDLKFAKDRDSHFTFIQAGAIKKITYPTGKFTQVSYEANTVNLLQMDEPIQKGSGQIKHSDFDTECGAVTDVHSITINNVVLDDSYESKLIINLKQLHCTIPASDPQSQDVETATDGYNILVFVDNVQVQNTNYSIGAGTLEKGFVLYKSDLIEDLGLSTNTTYSLKFEYDVTGSGSTIADAQINYYKVPFSYVDKEVGGLRIKSLQSNSVTKSYDYTKDNNTPALPGPSQGGSIDLNFCEECSGNIPPPNPAPTNNNGCNGLASDQSTIYVPCNTNLGSSNAGFTIGSKTCSTSDVNVRLEWYSTDSPHQGSYVYTILAGTSYSGSLSFNDLSITKGHNYFFKIFTPAGDNGFINADGAINVTLDPITQPTNTNTGGSSGVLVNVPTMIGYNQVKDEFTISTNPYTQFISMNGSHIVYADVKESINNGAFGYTTYEFDMTGANKLSRLLPNYLKPELPILPFDRPRDEMKLGTRFGSLLKTTVYDGGGATVSSTELEYKEETISYFADDVRMYQHLLLPNKTTTTMDGVTTISEIEYDSDLRHLSPIKTSLYTLANPNDKKVTEIKYAHEMGAGFESLITRNCISIPIETKIDGAAGGGTKIDLFVDGNGKIRSDNTFIFNTDGTLKLVRTNVSYNGEGIPTEIWNVGASKNTILTVANGLVTSSNYGNRTSNTSFDDKRRFVNSTNPDGIGSSIDQYDPFNRVKESSAQMGTVKSIKSYDISLLENEITHATTKFPGDSYNLGERITESVYDDNGQMKKSTAMAFADGGGDYTVSSNHDAIGREILSCDPGSGGCSKAIFPPSMLSRPTTITPAGSSQQISYIYGTNGTTIASYNPGSLYKTLVTDENGIQSASYKDIFGRTIQTIADVGGLDAKTTYTYNKRNQLLTVTAPDETTIYTYTYDKFGRMTSKTIPDKGSHQYITYNSFDQLEEEILPNGHTMKYQYDANYNSFLTGVYMDNDIIKIFTPENINVSDRVYKEEIKILGIGDWLTNTYTYDNLKRLETSIIKYMDGTSNFTYAYDAMGNTRSVTRNHTGPDGSFTVTHGYDYDKGLRLKATIASFPEIGGLVLNQMNYDGRDWMVSKAIGTGLQNINYGYTSRGWLESINNAGGTYPGGDPCDDPITVDPDENVDCLGPYTFTSIKLLYNCIQLATGAQTNITMEYENFLEMPSGTTTIGSGTLIVPFNGGTEDMSITYTQEQEFNTQGAGTGAGDLDGILDIIADCITANGENELGLDNNYQLQNILYELTEASNNYNASLQAAQGPDPAGGSTSIFGMNMYYTTENLELDAPAQYNGNMSWMKWRVNGENLMRYGFQYDNLNRMTQAKFGSVDDQCLPINAGAYDVNVGYDIMGNILTLTRQGMTNHNNSSPVFGIIDNLNYTYSGNQLTKVTDSGPTDKGFKSSSSSYGYTDGNINGYPSKGVSSIVYNYLDLPTQIVSPLNGTIDIIYDANGAKLKQIITPNVGAPVETLYHGGIEYTDNILTSIAHEEGRIVYNGSLPGIIDDFYAEFNVTDHLGNVRTRCIDKNKNGKIDIHNNDQNKNELGASYHYYPFGHQMEGNFFATQGVTNKYRYNGIEFNEELGIDLSFATYRTLDATIGRWLQVDPEAESFYGMTPYNSMGNNPILNADPEGDFFVAAIAFGAATGIFSNGLSNITSGKGFLDGAAMAGLWGGIGGAASFGIGSAFGATGSVGHEFLRGGAHALSSGLQSELQGGSFLQGALSGGLSSAIGSGIDALGGGAADQIIGGGLGGGIGAAISGGNFFHGLGQGIAVGAFNHAMHNGANSPKSEKEEDCCSGFEIAQKQRIKELLKGEITKEQYLAWHKAQGDGALFALSLSPIGRLVSGLKSLQFGKWAFKSKFFGGKSSLFGRAKLGAFGGKSNGIFNRHKIRIGWSWNNATKTHTFQPRFGPKYDAKHYNPWIKYKP